MMEPLDFSVSARSKVEIQPMADYVGKHFFGVPIRSIFGFREHTKLYGGRQFEGPEISEGDIRWMYDQGIGYRIPLQSIQATYEDYKESKAFLAKYHQRGNSVILVRHDIAEWVRNDFPEFEIEASVIHQVRTVDRLPRLDEIFDIVVLHPCLNDQADVLSTIERKDRIRLFANAGCMYRCPTMECYKTFSANNRGESVPYACSQQHVPGFHAQVNFHTFDVDQLVALGFRKFKKLRSKGITGY
ncbi:MAG: hypothetical protein NTX56_19650 [Proteobacteria bacterium]|nr:hypothetical protein [Pseudomonadota bacterium]